MSKYVPPQIDIRAFTCAACGTYAQQFWSLNVAHRPHDNGHYVHLTFSHCVCTACGAASLWNQDSKAQIFPKLAAAPMPHPDLPKQCQADYLEARNVAADSPRSAAALLRLCVQRLMIDLGQKGKRIDDDIAALVAAGLPPLVQQALDICRVVGNNAVHPGELSLEDNPEIVGRLFDLINFIVAQTIERENTIAALYGSLPAGAVVAIDKRDRRAA